MDKSYEIRKLVSAYEDFIKASVRFKSRSAGRILAKTGTITYVNSLSGYATTADDEQIAFSIICNDETSKGPSTQVIDKIADLLASFSGSPR